MPEQVTLKKIQRKLTDRVGSRKKSKKLKERQLEEFKEMVMQETLEDECRIYSKNKQRSYHNPLSQGEYSR